jgi:oligopeptide/dipeptide ABC transporter ATP-binding protein|tara:strand:+ start:1943 stop:2902 length:960 start_codon:yes stop_codon:yes gene_type:complete
VKKLAEISNLEVKFKLPNKELVHALNGVNINIHENETLGLIGESGSGKSTLGKALLGLIEYEGKINLFQRDLDLNNKLLIRNTRKDIGVVFQEPFLSLNPRMKIKNILAEPLVIHNPNISKDEINEKTRISVENVFLNTDYLEKYPSQLSGGEQQRIGIARAIINSPKLIILDEPTSSLDLSVRNEILRLLKNLQMELGLTYLFISHDIHTIKNISNRTAVMYLGSIMELGETKEVIENPVHPYTKALLSSVLSPNPKIKKTQIKLKGEIPKVTSLPRGCLFSSRCPNPTEDCKNGSIERELIEVSSNHYGDKCCVNCL